MRIKDRELQERSELSGLRDLELDMSYVRGGHHVNVLKGFTQSPVPHPQLSKEVFLWW